MGMDGKHDVALEFKRSVGWRFTLRITPCYPPSYATLFTESPKIQL